MSCGHSRIPRYCAYLLIERSRTKPWLSTEIRRPHKAIHQRSLDQGKDDDPWDVTCFNGSYNKSRDFLIPSTSILQMRYIIAFCGNTGSFRKSNVYPRTQTYCLEACSFQAPLIEVTTCQKVLSMRARLSCLFASDFQHTRYICRDHPSNPYPSNIRLAHLPD